MVKKINIYNFRKFRNKFKVMFIFSLIIIYALITLYLSKFFIHYFYIKELEEEKCECSKDWKKKWVQYGPFINVFVGYLLIFFQYKLIFLKKKVNKIAHFIPIIFSFIYISYIYKLIKTDCVCSENWKRDFILFFTIFTIIFQLFCIFLSLA